MPVVNIRDIPEGCFPPSVRTAADFTEANGDNPRAGDLYNIGGDLYHWDGSNWLPVSGDLTYVHTEATASATWTITHNLGKLPSVNVLDSSNRVVVGDVRHISNNIAQITFSSAFAGSATLN